MKKYTLLFLAMLLTGLLTACAEGPTVSDASPSSSLTPSLSESVSISTSSETPGTGGATGSEIKSSVTNESRSDGSVKKPLVIYFSRTGNTKTVAEQIAELTGGDLFEIQTVATYPAEYEATTEVAKKEQNENARPELSTTLENLADYDTVFIGYPIWWGHMPMAVYSFLDAYDFSEKAIFPFCTHGGSGLSGTDASIQTEEPNAAVSVALAIDGSSAADSEQIVTDWLKNSGVLAE